MWGQEDCLSIWFNLSTARCLERLVCYVKYSGCKLNFGVVLMDFSAFLESVVSRVGVKLHKELTQSPSCGIVGQEVRMEQYRCALCEEEAVALFKGSSFCLAHLSKELASLRKRQRENREWEKKSNERHEKYKAEQEQWDKKRKEARWWKPWTW